MAALVGLACLLLLGVAILCLPETAAIALLNLLILFTGVALTRGFHEGGIDNLAFVERQTERIQICPELVEQKVERSSLAQAVTTCPNGLLVWNLCHGVNAKELAGTGAVDYLILNLVVAQAIITLKKYDFEHEYYIYRLAACGSLALLSQQYIFKNWAEHLEVHQ